YPSGGRMVLGVADRAPAVGDAGIEGGVAPQRLDRERSCRERVVLEVDVSAIIADLVAGRIEPAGASVGIGLGFADFVRYRLAGTVVLALRSAVDRIGAAARKVGLIRNVRIMNG